MEEEEEPPVAAVCFACCCLVDGRTLLVPARDTILAQCSDHSSHAATGTSQT